MSFSCFTFFSKPAQTNREQKLCQCVFSSLPTHCSYIQFFAFCRFGSYSHPPSEFLPPRCLICAAVFAKASKLLACRGPQQWSWMTARELLWIGTFFAIVIGGSHMSAQQEIAPLQSTEGARGQPQHVAEAGAPWHRGGSGASTPRQLAEGCARRPRVVVEYAGFLPPKSSKLGGVGIWADRPQAERRIYTK